MLENRASLTSLKVAMRRAAHQLLDRPCVFEDPLALRILGPEHASALTANPRLHEDSPVAPYLRAFMAARSRYAEDRLHTAVAEGTSQYVILGAGLDTFAYRNPYPPERLRVFEVDHPATQEWKRRQLAEAQIDIPPDLVFAPVDFESQTLNDALRQAGHDACRPTFFSWLGVTIYLAPATVMATLRFVAGLATGSEIIFDYGISPELMDVKERRVFDAMAAKVALAGEPWQAFFEPVALERDLRALGFTQAEDVGQEQLNARYFAGRSDGLQVGSLARILRAKV
jgi:methyltransferase (TIGR00027 family)